MVERSLNTNTNEEIDAFTAHETDPNNKYDYKCWDKKCAVPLTLYDGKKENKYHFTISDRSKHHIDGCLAISEKNNYTNYRKKSSLIANKISSNQLQLTSRRAPEAVVDNENKMTEKKQKTNDANRTKKQKTNLSSIQTIIDRVQNGTISRDYIVPVHFEYDNPELEKDINGLNGNRLINELIFVLKDNFKIDENIFYYFAFKAFVDDKKNYFQITSTSKDSNGNKLRIFIPKDKSFYRTTWSKNLIDLSKYKNNRKKEKVKQPGWIFAAGNLKYNEKYNSYNLQKEFKSTARNFYVPNNWSTL